MDALIEMQTPDWLAVADMIEVHEGEPGVRRGLAQWIRRGMQVARPNELAGLWLYPADAVVVRAIRDELPGQDARDTIADIARMLAA